MHQNGGADGRPQWGSLQRSPDPDVAGSGGRAPGKGNKRVGKGERERGWKALQSLDSGKGLSGPPPAIHHYNLRSSGIMVTPSSGPLLPPVSNIPGHDDDRRKSRPPLDQTPLLLDNKGSLCPPDLTAYDGSERVEEGLITETSELTRRVAVYLETLQYRLEESVSHQCTRQVTQLFTYLLTHNLFSFCIRQLSLHSRPE